MEGIELMQKPAPTDFPVHELIRERWSPRAFADRPVPQNVLRSIFEAARWAPSSSNEQPWAYLVAPKDDKVSFANMLSVLVEFNANWAKSAPVLAIAVAHLAFAKNNAPNRNAQYDTGAATALGYPGDPASLPQPLKDREMAPRTRKPIAEFVMAGHWGHTASFAEK